METTLNIRSDLLKKITYAAQSQGITCSDPDNPEKIFLI